MAAMFDPTKLLVPLLLSEKGHKRSICTPWDVSSLITSQK
jgi:hypothetical protein